MFPVLSPADPSSQSDARSEHLPSFYTSHPLSGPKSERKDKVSDFVTQFPPPYSVSLVAFCLLSSYPCWFAVAATSIFFGSSSTYFSNYRETCQECCQTLSPVWASPRWASFFLASSPSLCSTVRRWFGVDRRALIAGRSRYPSTSSLR